MDEILSWRTSKPTLNGDQKLISDERRDLIKRLFAVAISVGFGAAVTKATWVKNGTLPSLVDAPQLAIIIVALSATILSWDGYHKSIERKPLKGLFRFGIDVILVFSYMFLFLTSAHQSFFIPILCVMFFLYAVWDAASIYEYPEQFVTDASSKYTTYLTAYTSGWFPKGTVNSGPIITLSWGAVFLLLFALQNVFLISIYVICAASCIALWFYRRDKQMQSGDIRGYTFYRRLIRIAALVVGAYVTRYLF